MTQELVLEDITLRNFMAYGDRPTRIRLDQPGITVVRGESGSGKSSIFDAISFALTGKPIRPKPLGAFVNNVNKKKMEVTLNLRLGDQMARISRGQKPGFVKFWRKSASDPRPIEHPDFSESRDGTDATSAEIERFLGGLDNALLTSMAISSTRRKAFLDCESSVQKQITESLFRFTELVRRAEVDKKAREPLELELAGLRTLQSSALEQRVRADARIAQLRAESDAWSTRKRNRIAELEGQIAELSDIDWQALRDAAAEYVSAIARYEKASASAFQEEERLKEAEARKRTARTVHATLVSSGEKLSAITDADLDAGILALDAIDELSAMEVQAKSEERAAYSVMQAAMAKHGSLKLAMERHENDGGCPTCGQEWPDADARTQVHERMKQELAAAEAEASEAISVHGSAATVLEEIQSALMDARKGLRWTTRKTLEETRSDRDRSESLIAEAKAKLDGITLERMEQIRDEAEAAAVSAKAEVAAFEGLPFYGLNDPASYVCDMRTEADRLDEQLAALRSEVDPNIALISEVEASIPAMPDAARISSLESEVAASIALGNLLTRKDSPIRSAVLGRYLPALNSKITEYLGRLSLPYTVAFSGDLEVEIRDGDDGVVALSGGEEERLAMALNWAFRDVYEDMSGTKLGFIGIDERLDVGLGDIAPVAMDVMSELAHGTNRSVWIITHRPELETGADHVVRAGKASRFTELSDR